MFWYVAIKTMEKGTLRSELKRKKGGFTEGAGKGTSRKDRSVNPSMR